MVFLLCLVEISRGEGRKVVTAKLRLDQVYVAEADCDPLGHLECLGLYCRDSRAFEFALVTISTSHTSGPIGIDEHLLWTARGRRA